MTIDEPVQLKVFIVVTKRIDQLFCHFQETHEEEELEDGEDGNVQIDVERNPSAWHPCSFHSVWIQLLPPDDGEDEEDVGGEGDDLGVDHGDGDPVIAPEQAALCSEFTKLLEENAVNWRKSGGGDSIPPWPTGPALSARLNNKYHPLHDPHPPRDTDHLQPFRKQETTLPS